MDIVIRGREDKIKKLLKTNKLFLKRNSLEIITPDNDDISREDELNKKNVKELKDIAKDLEIENYQSLKKQQLVDSILIQEEINLSEKIDNT